MALPVLTRRLVEEKLATYCRKKCPPQLKDQVRLAHKIIGNNVTLFEERPAFGTPDTWVDIVVAQFRFVPDSKEWSLYCADRNSRWHLYYDLNPQRDFEMLLKEVDDDPTGIFWG